MLQPILLPSKPSICTSRSFLASESQSHHWWPWLRGKVLGGSCVERWQAFSMLARHFAIYGAASEFITTTFQMHEQCPPRWISRCRDASRSLVELIGAFGSIAPHLSDPETPFWSWARSIVATAFEAVPPMFGFPPMFAAVAPIAIDSNLHARKRSPTERSLVQDFTGAHSVHRVPTAFPTFRGPDFWTSSLLVLAFLQVQGGQDGRLSFSSTRGF